MDFVMSYVLIPFIKWGQYFFYFVILFIAANKRFSWLRYFSSLSYKFLIWSVIGFKFFYASIETFGQYYIWSDNKFTKLLLDQIGYFIFYSLGRFWLEIVVSLVAALAFYLFLVFLKKYKERFFEEGEVELGFILALTVGWSNFIVFLPLVFLSVILVSIFRKIVFKETYTTLGAPLLLAALLVLLFGRYFIDILGLAALRV